MAKTVVIYHGNCADGFTAAWVVRRWWDASEAKLEAMVEAGAIERAENAEPNEIEFIAGVYQKPVDLERLRDNFVIIVDFSYKAPVMRQIIEVAKRTFWIDHHKSAILDMDACLLTNGSSGESDKFEWLTDLERSGAGLAWDYFFPDELRPWLIKYVEDRDLWEFKYRDTRAIQAYIFSFPYDFSQWDEFAADLEDKETTRLYAVAGASIERKHFKDINELLPICTRHIRIGGHIVPVANLPYTMVSDAGHILATRNPSLFGICYYDGMDGRNFSLRSVDGGMDVSEIAKQFGGGGHAHAAGFRVSYEDAKQFELIEGDSDGRKNLS